MFTTEFGLLPISKGVGEEGRDVQRTEMGYKAADEPVTIYDFRATLLHLLGVDHTLTWNHNGLQRRLTDGQATL